MNKKRLYKACSQIYNATQEIASSTRELFNKKAIDEFIVEIHIGFLSKDKVVLTYNELWDSNHKIHQKKEFDDFFEKITSSINTNLIYGVSKEKIPIIDAIIYRVESHYQVTIEQLARNINELEDLRKSLEDIEYQLIAIKNKVFKDLYNRSRSKFLKTLPSISIELSGFIGINDLEIQLDSFDLKYQEYTFQANYTKLFRSLLRKIDNLEHLNPRKIKYFVCELVLKRDYSISI